MTINYHTPITTSAPANASTVNDPLGQLDSAIGNLTTSLTSSAQAIGAWIPLYNHTLTSNGEFDVDLSTITVDGISATSCDHLIIKILARSTESGVENLDALHIAFNTDTTTANGNYYRQNVIGRASTVFANTSQNSQIANVPTDIVNSNSFGFVTIEIPFFNGSHHKIVASNYYAHANTTTDGWAGQFAVRWLDTSAITRIRVRTDNHPTDSIKAGSKIQVWGIKGIDVLTNSGL